MTHSVSAELPTTREAMAKVLDYSDLRVNTRESDLRLLALEAEKFGIATIVVNPVNASLARALTRGTNIKVGVAVSYPVGAYWPEDKIREVQDAVEDGADEIHMMMAVGAFLNGWVEDFTLPEMKGLVRAAEGRPTRLITEIAVLHGDQQRWLGESAASAGIQALVCCSGFKPSKLARVLPGDVHALAEVAGQTIEIDYMGDVEDTAEALEILRAGASRICSESARRILEGFGGPLADGQS
jgi:deoxyribose-phosphate aldolase